MNKIITLLLAISSAASAQTLSLDSCVQMAKRNYPLLKQNALIRESEDNTANADTKNWLPKLSFISKATYQSEVVEFLGKSFPHDSYLAALDLEQTLFDGGVIHQQKELDKLSSETDLAKNQVELYKLIDRIDQLYSSLLLARESIKTLTAYKEDITNKKTVLSASVTNGMSLQSNLDALEAEELKTEQSLIEARDNEKALEQTLGMFINKNIDGQTELSYDPLTSDSKGDAIQRPELKLFDSQKALLEAKHKLVNRYAVPKISLSGEGAYGRPGPNFLNQDLRFFGQAGISLKWNLGSLYSFSNEKQNFSINTKMVDVQREVFEFNLKTTLISQDAQIASMKEILEKDRIIIEKRHNIKETASAQLANGSITSTDYLTESNAELQAQLNQKVHEIKLMNAISNYNSTKGISNF
ncbi:MAG: TolC family protein [Bacteroidia bacterium]